LLGRIILKRILEKQEKRLWTDLWKALANTIISSWVP
jgi:hypothetical protein